MLRTLDCQLLGTLTLNIVRLYDRIALLAYVGCLLYTGIFDDIAAWMRQCVNIKDDRSERPQEFLIGTVRLLFKIRYSEQCETNCHSMSCFSSSGLACVAGIWSKM